MADDQAPDLSQLFAGQPALPPSVDTGTPQMPQLAPGTVLPPQQSQQQSAPKPRPILLDLISGLVHPQAQNLAANRPTSRTDVLENFLGNFAQALGAGFANEGRGPGAAMRGAGAAIGAPYQASLQRYQMGQEAQEGQARIQQQQAQTGLLQKQSELAGQMATINVPGMGPMTIPVNQLGNILKGSAAAGITAQAKLTSDQFKAQLASGQVAFTKPSTDPQTGQIGVMAYNKQGQPLGLLPGATDPAALPTVNTSQQWLETSPGTWQLVNKTSTSQKVVPPSPLAQLQGNVPAVGASQTPRQKLAQKVPALAAAQSKGGGRKIYGDTPMVAFDPQTQERVVTNPAEIAAKGYQQPVAIKEGDMEKWRTSQVQFNDVQTNTSRYTAAANAYAAANLSAATKADDQIRLHNLLNKAGVFDMELKIAEGGEIRLPILSALTEGLNRQSKTDAYAGLSPQAKSLYDGYLRTMASVPAYQKALTGIGRLNKEVIELELQNIPNPSMDPRDIQRKLGQWQENIDQGATGIPRIAGIPTIKDIRAKFEGGGNSINVNSLLPLGQQWTQPWARR